ncbi:myoD family inhibitor domain-containing protein 2 [Electrophorus electricus]|uniref:myoD family inhibitor domain-containing protein 2 n=1 Tax=Electrophorus electricus TaxID=8005 RepID=UPI0015D05690|nr:myoD family inhibitor domain-containing protein 2 [Electrophorus electricus]
MAPGRTQQRRPDLDSGENKGDVGPPGSTYSLYSVDQCSTDSLTRSTDSKNSLTLSQDVEDACAMAVLNCLFCRFYDLCFMLPDTCESVAIHTCPSCQILLTPLEPAHNNDWSCHCNLDCGLFNACHETGECLELAMEISEICYR